MSSRRICVAILALAGITVGVCFVKLRSEMRSAAQRNAGALQELASLSDPKELLQTGELLGWRGNWVRARPYFAQAEQLSAILHNEPLRLRAHLGFLRASLEHIPLRTVAVEVDQLIDTPLVAHDPNLLIRALAVKAEVSFHFDLDVCYKTLYRIQQLAIQLHDPAWANRASGDMGGIAFHKGTYYLGLVDFNLALAKAELYKDVGAQMRYRSFLGEALVASHQYSSATLFFESAIRLESTTPGAAAPFSSRIGLARCLLFTHHEAAGIAKLQSFLVEARAMDLEIRELNILTALLEYYLTIDLFTAESANVARRSYTLASQHGLQRLAIYSTIFLAKYGLLTHNLSAAEQYAELTVSAMRRSPDVYNLPGILWILATLHVANDELETADATYQESIDTVDSILSDIPTPNQRNTVIAATTPIYKDYITFLIDKLRQPARAFGVIERTRARSIDDFSAHNAYEANFDHSFDSRIRSLTRAVYLDRRAELSTALWDTETRAARFSSYTAKLPEIKVPSIAAIQRCLEPSEMIIAYFSSSPDSFAISITDRTFHVTKLLPATAFAPKVRILVSNVMELKPMQNLAQQLYAELVAPIPFIAEHSDLIIIPDSALNGLAFEMLIDNSARYLVETHAVSYTPSATALQIIRSHTDRPPSAFLGVGGVNYGFDSATRGIVSVPGSPFNIVMNAFTDLPTAMRETVLAENTVNAEYNELLIGKDATEERLKALDLDPYRVIHFAVHGIIDDQFSERNALLLGDSPSSREDGFLQVREIRKLRLHAQLVTLASCVSAVGPAEGLAAYGSLAQAFLSAGAHSVLASDWHVDDRMTSKLMAYFYTHLSEGVVTSKALQLAKLDVMARYGGDAPYYWAGFRIIGNGNERIRDR